MFRKARLDALIQRTGGRQLQLRRHTKKSTMSTSLAARRKRMQAQQRKCGVVLAKSHRINLKHRSHKFSLQKGKSDFSGKIERIFMPAN